jgi:Zn-dependent protease
MFEEDFLRRAVIAAPAILFSLTVHEFFHAWTAHKFGDDTAKDLGRLTLNPLAHLDLLGTIALFLTSFRFGWAKPVPVNPFNLRNPRTADIWISAAGPLSNLGLALIFGIIFRAILEMQIQVPEAIAIFLYLSVTINVSLAFFNLVPLYPLDGSHVLRNLLPPSMEEAYAKLDTFAPILLMLLAFSGVLWIVLGPIVGTVISLILGAPVQ